MIFSPKQLYYLMSFACNERCTKCHHWTIRPAPKPIDPELVSNAVRSIPDPEEFCIVGGEPLVFAENVLSIIEATATERCRVVLITNGVLLKPSMVKRVAHLNIHIVISIDTVDEEKWRFVRGRDTMDRVLANLRQAAAILRPGQLSIQSVLAKETASEMAGVANLAEELGVHHSIQDYMNEGFEGEWTPLQSSQRRVPDSEPCYATGRNLSIMHDGDVFTCFQQSWIPNCGKPLGNLKTDSIETILSSDYTEQVQTAMSRCNLPCKVLKCNQKAT